MTESWTGWLIGTIVWMVIAVAIVAVVWGPDPISLGITAVLSFLMSLFAGNRWSTR